MLAKCAYDMSPPLLHPASPPPMFAPLCSLCVCCYVSSPVASLCVVLLSVSCRVELLPPLYLSTSTYLYVCVAPRLPRRTVGYCIGITLRPDLLLCMYVCGCQALPAARG